jgi:hypothetical protein
MFQGHQTIEKIIIDAFGVPEEPEANLTLADPDATLPLSKTHTRERLSEQFLEETPFR